jgi:NAD+ diphosphatase
LDRQLAFHIITTEIDLPYTDTNNTRPPPKKQQPGHGLPTVSLPAYLLGQDRASRRWALALDISGARDTFLVFLRDGCGLAVAARDLRTLLPGLSPDALALAGHAAALSSWHQTHVFCPRCGAATEPSEGGARRRCGGPGAHKLYPRTDPVVIALVESPGEGGGRLSCV